MQGALAVLAKHDLYNEAAEKLLLLGVRGYFRNTMGVIGKNDIGIYDDALIWIGPETFASFNANTDPSKYKYNVATLRTGKWKYRPGTHRGLGSKKPAYEAFTQADKVIVDRYREAGPWVEDYGRFGINIHMGAYQTTSSLGCQTIYPPQWLAFKELGYAQLHRLKQKEFTYLLVSNDGEIA